MDSSRMAKFVGGHWVIGIGPSRPLAGHFSTLGVSENWVQTPTICGKFDGEAGDSPVDFGD